MSKEADVYAYGMVSLEAFEFAYTQLDLILGCASMYCSSHWVVFRLLKS